MSKFYGYIGEYSIRTSEIDAQKRIKVDSLIQLMQETSMQNVLSLKLSVWDLEDKALSWVLLKKEIHIHSYPSVGDNIKIKTYPAGFERIFAYRDFKIYNSEDEIMATAASVWGLLDTKSRSLIKIPSYEFYDVIPENELDRPSFKLSEKIEEQHSITFNIMWRHLDWNHHVNNVVLVQKMLDAIPVEFLRSHTLSQFSIQFKNESILEDHLISSCEIVKGEIKHTIKRVTDNVVVALAKSRWRD